MFCNHRYKTIKSERFDEELSKFNGVRMDGFTARSLAERGVITISECEKCGKVKHIKTVL